MSRFYEYYKQEVVPSLMKQFAYTSVMAVPKLLKITLNMGVGEAATDKKIINAAISDMAIIAGQQPVTTMSKASIAGFKIRENWPIGCKVTLRKHKMYDFLDRLITIALPRVRDFRGLSVRSFDGSGNYSLGIKEQIVFPEIDYDKIDVIRGMDIIITTSASSDREAFALLSSFNFPFKEKQWAN